MFGVGGAGNVPSGSSSWHCLVCPSRLQDLPVGSGVGFGLRRCVPISRVSSRRPLPKSTKSRKLRREMQGIQDEVEGVGKSARGDFKELAPRLLAPGKRRRAPRQRKAPATASNPARSTSSSKTTPTAKKAGANRTRSKAAQVASSMEVAPWRLRLPRKTIHWLMSPSSTSMPSWSLPRTGLREPTELPRMMRLAAFVADVSLPPMPSETAPSSGSVLVLHLELCAQ